MKKHYVVLVLVVIGLIAISGCVDKSEVKSVTEDEHQIDKPSVESVTKDEWAAGECPPPMWVKCTEEEKKAEICTADYTPVCGDDGKTYSNRCSACSSGEIDEWAAGECLHPVWTTCTEEQKQNKACTREYAPVCGDNGKTYGNKCSACSSGEITAWTVGECANVWTPCTAEQKQNQMCTMEYVPVCGDNGKTYGNKCSACSSGEITTWTFGECPQKWTPCTEEQKQNKACTVEYVPVCGDNGKTYANKCEACSSGEVNSWTEGECPPPVWLNCTEEEKKAGICTLDYTPVCGDNGKTYGNKCEACSSGDINAWTVGECANVWTPCTAEQKQNQMCTMEYVPVCGDNGKTYGNKCSACSSGEIDAWTFGECP